MKLFAIFTACKDGSLCPLYFTEIFPLGISEGSAQGFQSTVQPVEILCKLPEVHRKDYFIRSFDALPEEVEKIKQFPKTLPECYRFVWCKGWAASDRSTHRKTDS